MSRFLRFVGGMSVSAVWWAVGWSMVAVRALRPSTRRTHGDRSMQLVYLTAMQDPPADASVDRPLQRLLLQGALRGALASAAIEAAIVVDFTPSELTARIETPDATLAFATVARVFLESPYCTAGYVLLRYGPPGAGERQVKLSGVPRSTRKC